MTDTYKYDPSNPHTRYNPKDPVDSAIMNKMTIKERSAYLDELNAYDKAQREKKKEAKEGTVSGPEMKNEVPKKMAKGGSVSSASKRADGCCTKGKTKGKMI